MSRDDSRSVASSRTSRVLLGAVLGALVGAVVGLNLLIYAGIEGGYEASLAEAFDQRPAVAFTILVVLVGSPMLGGLLAVRYRRHRSGRP